MTNLLGAFVALCGTSAAADQAPKPVEQLLASMRRAYSSAKSVSMQVSVKLHNPSGQATGRFAFRYQQPNLIRYTGDVGRNHIERYCDGKTVTTIVNDQRSSTNTINVDTLGGRVPGNLEWLSFFDWKRQLSTTPGSNMANSSFKLIPSQSWKSKKWIALDETAPSVGLQVRYFIDPKTYFIWRCDVTSLSEKRLVVQTEVTKMELGVSLNPSIFQAPP